MATQKVEAYFKNGVLWHIVGAPYDSDESLNETDVEAEVGHWGKGNQSRLVKVGEPARKRAN